MPQNWPIQGSSRLLVKNIAATAYTFEISGVTPYYLRFTSSSPVTATVPADADVPYAIGSTIQFTQAGTGLVTVAAAAGVTINPAAGALSGQGAVAGLIKVDVDEWDFFGGLA